MPIARLITCSPELTHTVTESLESAGYSVEIATPDQHFDSTADLEINLDDPSASFSYLVTADGREIAFVYDEVAEREFVLAPAWRAFLARLRPLFARMHRPVSEAVSAPASSVVVPPVQIEQPAIQMTELPKSEPVVEAQPFEAPAPVRLESEIPDYAFMADTTVLAETEIPAEERMEEVELAPLPSEVVAHSIYLPERHELIEPAPEPVAFSSAEYFDGNGTRKHASEFSPRAHEVQEVKVTEQEPEPAVMMNAPSAMVQWALRADTFKSRLASQWAARRAAVQAAAKRVERPSVIQSVTQYDLAWMRAVPVAAVIALAFLLGWGVSSASGDRKASSNAPAANVNHAVIPAAATATPVKAQAIPATVKKASPSRPARQRDLEGEEYDDEVASDVVVRHYPKHYPSKEVRAANQKSVKRFSDVD